MPNITSLGARLLSIPAARLHWAQSPANDKAQVRYATRPWLTKNASPWQRAPHLQPGNTERWCRRRCLTVANLATPGRHGLPTSFSPRETGSQMASHKCLAVHVRYRQSPEPRPFACSITDGKCSTAPKPTTFASRHCSIPPIVTTQQDTGP